MAIWWSLALVWLIAGQTDAASSTDEQPLRIEVRGYGATVDVARRSAIREAVLEMTRQLRKHQPPLVHWEPTEAIVEANLLDGPGQPDADLAVEGIGNAKTWLVTLKVPSSATLEGWDRLAAREERSEQRLGSALHVVAGLLFMLVVGIGYLRLDDWTRSRYTPWLRAASIALIAGGALSWWWTH